MSWFYWALVAAVFWGLGPVFAKLGLAKPDPLTALLIRSAAVLVVLITWAVLRGDTLKNLGQIDAKTYWLLILEGGFASVIAHYAYFSALKTGSVANVIPITASYPLFSVALSVVLLRSGITAGRILGAALTVLGVFLLQRY
ncbi:MAG: EamA family transporter [Bacillota bacterium]